MYKNLRAARRSRREEVRGRRRRALGLVVVDERRGLRVEGRGFGRVRPRGVDEHVRDVRHRADGVGAVVDAQGVRLLVLEVPLEEGPLRVPPARPGMRLLRACDGASTRVRGLTVHDPRRASRDEPCEDTARRCTPQIGYSFASMVDAKGRPFRSTFVESTE